MAIAFPSFDPVAVSIGPLAVRWYALAYIAGLLGGWWYLRRLFVVHVLSPKGRFHRDSLDDLVSWLAVGVIVGGRVGYVFFYNPHFYLHNPLEAFMIWKGGMSFHGGLAGSVAAIFLFARQRHVSFFDVGDAVALVAPIGLFFGRVANFINGELWGRTTDVAWAVLFPTGGPVPRHPSQLYEALLEGLILFLILQWVVSRGGLRRSGLIMGCFGIGYAMARIFCELFREPDAQLGFLVGGLTMGMLLSLPMFFLGLFLVRRAFLRPLS